MAQKIKRSNKKRLARRPTRKEAEARIIRELFKCFVRESGLLTADRVIDKLLPSFNHYHIAFAQAIRIIKTLQTEV